MSLIRIVLHTEARRSHGHATKMQVRRHHCRMCASLRRKLCCYWLCNAERLQTLFVNCKFIHVTAVILLDVIYRHLLYDWNKHRDDKAVSNWITKSEERWACGSLKHTPKMTITLYSWIQYSYLGEYKLYLKCSSYYHHHLLATDLDPITLGSAVASDLSNTVASSSTLLAMLPSLTPKQILVRFL